MAGPTLLALALLLAGCYDLTPLPTFDGGDDAAVDALDDADDAAPGDALDASDAVGDTP